MEFENLKIMNQIKTKQIEQLTMQLNRLKMQNNSKLKDINIFELFKDEGNENNKDNNHGGGNLLDKFSLK